MLQTGLQGYAPAQQSGPVHFTGETDRVYLDTTADCVIDDANQQRRITVAPGESHALNMRVSVAGTGTYRLLQTGAFIP